jgi:hypothetical protein
VLFLRLVPDDATTDTTIFEGKRAQMAGHIVRSHVGGAVVWPFSSLHRLVFLVTDTGVDTIRWTSLAGISDEPSCFQRSEGKEIAEMLLAPDIF